VREYIRRGEVTRGKWTAETCVSHTTHIEETYIISTFIAKLWGFVWADTVAKTDIALVSVKDLNRELD